MSGNQCFSDGMRPAQRRVVRKSAWKHNIRDTQRHVILLLPTPALSRALCSYGGWSTRTIHRGVGKCIIRVENGPKNPLPTPLKALQFWQTSKFTFQVVPRMIEHCVLGRKVQARDCALSASGEEKENRYIHGCSVHRGTAKSRERAVQRFQFRRILPA